MASTMSRVNWRRMAGGKPHTADARNLADRDEQLGERQLPFRVKVAIHVLAQKLDFGIAEVGYAPGFFENGG